MLAQRPGSRADKGWQQDAPPPPPPPPPLPAPKTRLQSKASLFVPKALAGAQGEGVQHISGKECLRTLIQNTLGNQMLDFFMVDQQSYTGECYTNINITIPCPMLANDAESFASAQQATHSMATETVMQALQTLSPKVSFSRSQDGMGLSVQYCAADKDMLCWEFAHLGHCPRGSTCRWAHCAIETFMIMFLVTPFENFAPWGCGTDITPTPGVPVPQGNWQPQAVPNAACVPCFAPPPAAPPPTMEEPCDRRIPLGLPMTDILDMPPSPNVETDRSDDTPWPDFLQASFEVDATKTQNSDNQTSKVAAPKAVTPKDSRVMWADLEDDADDRLSPHWGFEA